MIALAPLGAFLIVLVLWDAFETMVLPRRIDRNFRLARFFYRGSWAVWRGIATRISREQTRESVLAIFGPLSILTLFALWAACLILGFALVLSSQSPHILIGGQTAGFGNTMYMSATNFFTLGLGDVAPNTAFARAVTATEAGTGFGFLALVIGYLPVLYQAFSRREVSISLLDARAGSPPSAGEIIRRINADGDSAEIERLLAEWERWSADLLETHLSYPILGYFRSQHDRESWLAALTAMLDFSALMKVHAGGRMRRQSQLSFAMARHAVVDLAQIFARELRDPDPPRLSQSEARMLIALCSEAGFAADDEAAAERQLNDLRATYEPYVLSLSEFFLMPLPPWVPATTRPDDWRTSDRESILS
ncbi:MAG: potassium channel family protein [Chloroflexota bacterium]|nr:potassium channel family protein [Chloroflexota bacterium]